MRINGSTPSRARTLIGIGLTTLIAASLAQSTQLFTLSQLDVLASLFGFIALAQSWNILAGFAGQISLGTSAFVGCGAYAAGLLELHARVGYGVAVLGSCVTGVLLAALLALPLLRLRGVYFAVGTLAAALALQAWMVNWSFVGGSTGLSLPLTGTPSPVIVYQLACAVGAIAVIVTCLVSRSAFGNRLRAIRDHEPAAIGLGVSAFRHRLAAFAISGGLSGLAGGLVAVQQISFEPVGMLGIGWTMSALLMTVVGGTGTIVGPVIGSVIVYYLLTRQLENYQTLSAIIEGILLIGVVRFAPEGVWPVLTRGLRWLRHPSPFGPGTDQSRTAVTPHGGG